MPSAKMRQSQFSVEINSLIYKVNGRILSKVNGCDKTEIITHVHGKPRHRKRRSQKKT